MYLFYVFYIFLQTQRDRFPKSRDSKQHIIYIIYRIEFKLQAIVNCNRFESLVHHLYVRYSLLFKVIDVSNAFSATGQRETRQPGVPSVACREKKREKKRIQAFRFLLRFYHRIDRQVDHSHDRFISANVPRSEKQDFASNHALLQTTKTSLNVSHRNGTSS